MDLFNASPALARFVGEEYQQRPKIEITASAINSNNQK
jgi:hypothetical protein